MADNENAALLRAFSPYYMAETAGAAGGPGRARRVEPVLACCGAPEPRAQALSITTRGLGLSACNLCYLAAAAADADPPLYAMYRAFLGLAEAKLAACPHPAGEPRAANAYSYKVKLYMLERAQTVTLVPEPIKRIIDAIDVVEAGATRYVPVVAGQLRDAAGRLVPRPENLLLSNLREAVVALSREATPCRFRAAFRDNCPIPGAVWDDGLLANADEIIPEDYNLADGLWDDMWPLCAFVMRLRRAWPALAAGPLLAKGAGASRAALISSHMSDLRAPPRRAGEPTRAYCARCHPLGFLGSYYELEEMSDAERVAGQVALLGELPNAAVLGELARPVRDVHRARQGCFDPAGAHVYGDYTTALMVSNEALLFPPGGAAGPAWPAPAPAPAAERDCRGWVTRTSQPDDSLDY